MIRKRSATNIDTTSFLRYYVSILIISSIPQKLHSFNIIPNQSLSATAVIKSTFLPLKSIRGIKKEIVKVLPLSSRRYDDDEDEEFEYVTNKSSRRRPYRTKQYSEEEDDFGIDDFDEELYVQQYTTIPNPELDYIDPDRTNERVMDELFTDMAFWKDLCIVLFVIFIWQEFFIPVNWLSELKHAQNLSGPFPLR